MPLGRWAFSEAASADTNAWRTMASVVDPPCGSAAAEGVTSGGVMGLAAAPHPIPYTKDLRGSNI